MLRVTETWNREKQHIVVTDAQLLDFRDALKRDDHETVSRILAVVRKQNLEWEETSDDELGRTLLLRVARLLTNT